MQRLPSTRSSQRGFILITSLIFLVVLTLLAVVAINSSTLNQRMAGNQQEKARALLAANAGLAHAEDLMADPSFITCTSLFTIPDPNQNCSSDAGTLARDINYATFGQGHEQGWSDVYSVNYVSNSFWNSGKTEQYDLPASSGASGATVSYRLDYLPFISRPSTASEPDAAYFFLVTARADSVSANASAVVQSIYEIDR